MSWSKLLAEKRVSREATSKAELDNLRSIVRRCLSDMNAKGLSDEQRFIIAYDAARTLALMVVRACGYRPTKMGWHHNTFMGLAAADRAFAATADYLDVCRLKRNESEYDFAWGVSETDAEELVAAAKRLHREVEGWIGAKHPGLV